jgi:hypothetical protein
MGQTPPVTPPTVAFDGTNSAEVVDLLNQADPSNPAMRGGVQLPAAPGDPTVMTVELADGTIHVVTSGDAVTVDPVTSAVSVTISPVTVIGPPITITSVVE